MTHPQHEMTCKTHTRRCHDGVRHAAAAPASCPCDATYRRGHCSVDGMPRAPDPAAHAHYTHWLVGWPWQSRCTDASCDSCVGWWSNGTKCADCDTSHFGNNCSTPCRCQHAANSSGVNGTGGCAADTACRPGYTPDARGTCTRASTSVATPRGTLRWRAEQAWLGDADSMQDPVRPATSPDGTSAYFVPGDGTVHAYHIADGTALWTLAPTCKRRGGAGINGLQLSADGSVAYVSPGCDDNVIAIDTAQRGTRLGCNTGGWRPRVRA